MTVEEIMTEMLRNRSFYRQGGLTATGGEPLMQIDFLTALFKRAKELDIHTCLDTSGITYTKEKEEKFQELFQYTDLIMLDIKTSDPVLHKELTAQPFDPVLQFAAATEKADIPLRIRHVLVPGYTFDEKKLFHVGQTIGRFKNLKELEVLPCHSMGAVKYQNLGMEYPLAGTPDLAKEEVPRARELIMNGIKDVRSKK